MTIKATVICDSISPAGDRLTTLICTYPRFIHQELLTHRDKSRNSASSRAIPTEKLIQRIIDDTAMPIHWGINQKGMQADSEASPEMRQRAINHWIGARDEAIARARWMADAGFHKQIVNRLLEPFMHMEIVLSATEWRNFFELRCHKDAQPEIQKLAWAIRDERDASSPIEVDYGEWHLPFIRDEERTQDTETLKKISAARCARVSYFLHDGQNSSIDKDLALFDRLAGSVPIHASPLEHQATPKARKNANFKGWMQFRWEVENGR